MPEISAIDSYHAHVYFDDAATRRAAETLRDSVAERFAIYVGRLIDRPIGPHPTPMFELGFEPADFAIVVPWLMLNRAGLSILIHPNTGDARRDHLENSIWLGDRKQLIVDPYLL